MPTAYALQGTHDSGKTSTLKRVNEILRKKYTVIAVIEDYFNSSRNPDYQGIYDIKVNDKTIRIGIISGGDEWECIRKILQHFQRHQCEIVFCACRSQGKTVAEIKNNYPQSYFLQKDRESNPSKQAQADERAALELIKMAGL